MTTQRTILWPSLCHQTQPSAGSVCSLYPSVLSCLAKSVITTTVHQSSVQVANSHLPNNNANTQWSRNNKNNKIRQQQQQLHVQQQLQQHTCTHNPIQLSFHRSTHTFTQASCPRDSQSLVITILSILTGHTKTISFFCTYMVLWAAPCPLTLTANPKEFSPEALTRQMPFLSPTNNVKAVKA